MESVCLMRRVCPMCGEIFHAVEPIGGEVDPFRTICDRCLLQSLRCDLILYAVGAAAIGAAVVWLISTTA